MKDDTFVNTFVQEVGNSPLRSALIGTWLNCDIYCTANAREYVDGGVGTDDVYSMLFMGMESHATTGIGTFLPKDVDMAGPEGLALTGAGAKANPVELIAKQLGSAGSLDPLNQRATLGWKMALDVEILNSAFIIDLEHTNSFSAA